MKNKKLWITVGVVILIVAIIIGIRIYQPEKEEDVIKIGAILPLTGPASTFGQYVKEGIDLAVEEINRESRSTILIIYEDSKNSPKEALSAYNKIVTTENPPVILAALSSVAKALAPLASKTNTIQLYVDVAAPGVADGLFTFRFYPEASGTAGTIAKFAAKYLKATKAAVIHINDEYGIASLEVFKKYFESFGSKVVFVETYDLLQKDFRNIFTKLKSLKPKPDVVYLNGYGPAFVTAVRQFKEMEVNIQLITDVALGLPENLKQAGKCAEGVYFVDGKISPVFINKFKHRYSKEPSSDAGYAYDVIMVLYKIFKENRMFTTNLIREKLKKLEKFPGMMGEITMKPNGDANLEFVINRVKDGKPERIEWEKEGL